jgi:sulfite reductase alpha subunit-like flavoprotein
MQVEKIYVQHLVQECEQLVKSSVLEQGGSIYVCG